MPNRSITPRLTTAVIALSLCAGTVFAGPPGGESLVGRYTETFSIGSPFDEPSINIFAGVAPAGVSDPFDPGQVFGVLTVTPADAGFLFTFPLDDLGFAPQVARLTDGTDDGLWLGADAQGWGDYRARSEGSLFTGVPGPSGLPIPGPDLAGLVPTRVVLFLEDLTLNYNGFETVGNATLTVRYFADSPPPPSSITFDLSDLEIDAAGQTVLELSGGEPDGRTVVGVDYDIEYATVGASWTEELAFNLASPGAPIDDPAQGGDGPADGEINFSTLPNTFAGGVSDVFLGGAAGVGLLDASGSTALLDGAPAGGTWTLVIGETFNDAGPDGVFLPGSTVTVRFSTPCGAADLAEPLGVLDLADITAFVVAFTAGDPAADLADPLGVLDLADIVAFVEAFNAGCP